MTWPLWFGKSEGLGSPLMLIQVIGIGGELALLLITKGGDKVKALVVLNEQHNLMDEQRSILDGLFDWTIKPVPASGWSLSQMRGVIQELKAFDGEVVFASPVPALLLGMEGRGFLFHNDRREKKELPNGKIIMTVAQTGWQLISVGDLI
jgi:hypothetical protein